MGDIDNSLPTLKRRAEIAASRGNEDALVAVAAIEAGLARIENMRAVARTVLETFPNHDTSQALIEWADGIEFAMRAALS